MPHWDTMPLTLKWRDECRLAGGLGAFDLPRWAAIRSRRVLKALSEGRGKSYVAPSRRQLEEIALAVLAEERRIGGELNDDQVRGLARELDAARVQTI
ncbi:MAG: hypothetical protein IPM64_17765 [Phycisphaerales bacterium]|nr:hypothetical protein [Phycisphaerales bacterium]